MLMMDFDRRIISTSLLPPAGLLVLDDVAKISSGIIKTTRRSNISCRTTKDGRDMTECQGDKRFFYISCRHRIKVVAYSADGADGARKKKKRNSPYYRHFERNYQRFRDLGDVQHSYDS